MMHRYSCRPGKLAPLAPLGGGGGGGLGAATRPLKSSGGGDIKDELRRAGLLTLPDGDSYSGHSSVEVSAGGSQPPPQRQQQARPARAVYDAEFSISNSNIEDMLGGAQVRPPGPLPAPLFALPGILFPSTAPCPVSPPSDLTFQHS